MEEPATGLSLASSGERGTKAPSSTYCALGGLQVPAVSVGGQENVNE